MQDINYQSSKFKEKLKMGKTSIKTKKEEIVKYWFFEQLVDERGLSVDAAEAHERCW